jgi:AraC-like DNA-binding protein/antibiotic biosynthesis monooxygenase (ABM) superfamily enzyme
MIGGVLLGGVLQSVGLAAAILAMGRDSIANRFLALTLAVLAGMMSVFVLGWTGRVEVSPWLAFLPVNLPLALGPALFAYILGLVRDEALGRWHFAPAAIHFFYLMVLQLLPEATQAAWKTGVHDAAVKPLVEIATVVSLVAYTVAGLRLLRAYRAWLAQQRSDADRYAARWIGAVMVTLALTTTALGLVRFYTSFVGELDTTALYLWFAGLSAWLGIEGWRQCDRRYPAMPAAAPAAEVAQAGGPDWAALGQRWRQEIEAQAWWRQPDLSLAEAARRVGTNTTYLSRAINEGLGLNFNELINRMRAEEVARQIQAADDPNFMQLALEAGFNSKATFNRAFRTVHGISPSDYRLRLKSQKSAGSPGSEAPNARSPGT